MNSICKIFLVLILTVFFVSCHKELVKQPVYNYSGMDDETIDLHKEIEEFLFLMKASEYPIKVHRATRITGLKLDTEKENITVEFSKFFSYVPFREDNVKQIYKEFKKTIDSDYEDYRIVIKCLDQPIENLVPNIYRKTFKIDSSRLSFQKPRPKPVVTNIDKGFNSPAGLDGFNVALWPSHGWYYNSAQKRWMWQRARLFGTVEDLHPLSFTIPYLVPMLEKAGANVFVPRERDLQVNEIIVDNDSYPENKTNSRYIESSALSNTWQSSDTVGFAFGDAPYPVNFNPFRSGTYRFSKTDTMESAYIKWIPEFPDSGFYAVYVSYYQDSLNTDQAIYTVYHSGDSTQFKINQQIGGRTWIYLGTFQFEKGYNPEKGSVKLSNKTTKAGLNITADAVKFGGGIGNVLRDDFTSNRPKFVEGARYYLQTSGFPDTLVYNLNEDSDYRDDYQSRGEWVNYLYGAPNGPNKNREVQGMGIPIDASLAFHTDAGITQNDTTIGTLLIYSVVGADTQTTFPSGESRFASRDFSDILQTQIVEDIRKMYDPVWTRRAIREAQYSEAYRPNVPAALLELMSHQNFLDMKFTLDPRFRFHTSRSIYKAILKFISSQNNMDFVVQPLPVDHFSAVFDDDNNILLKWEPVIDPLEETAMPASYKVYTRKNGNGFDNGVISKTNSFTLINPEPGIIYSFKVTAINEGGESFESEILSACLADPESKPVLIVNGFDRISGPEIVDEGDFKGFAYFLDNGVPDKYDLNFVGEQFNFDSSNKWQTDDRPGHGASYADYETKVIAGNTFDFPFVHGQAIRGAGFSFVSSSDEAVMDNFIKMTDYKIVDLIMGEEKETGWQKSVIDSTRGLSFKTFPEKLKRAVRSFLNNNGSLFISGAHIATDLYSHKSSYYPDAFFANQVLRYTWVTNHAVKTGGIFKAPGTELNIPEAFTFNTEFDPHIYRVEAPDAIGPAGGAKTILRYSENGFSAGVAYKNKYNIVALGFPFETILGRTHRLQIMKGILQFFEN